MAFGPDALELSQAARAGRPRCGCALSVESRKKPLRVGANRDGKDSMHLRRRMRALGFYLLVCSLYQASIYARRNGTASISDPRLGLWLLPGGGSRVPWIEWGSTVCLFCLGLWLALRPEKPPIVIYLMTESVLALPTGLYIAASLFGGAGHLTANGAELF